MSRLSDYTDADILKIITDEEYVRISGSHRNGASVHELKHKCGMVSLKTSKTLLSDKRGCGFSPCHPRGALSLLFLRSIAKANGIDDVRHERQDEMPLDRLVISAKDPLSWHKGDEVMSQSWQTVRARAFSAKGGTFFQADTTRRRPPAKTLEQTQLAQLCAARGFVPPTQVPARRSAKATYVHIACGEDVPLRFNELLDWQDDKCRHCHPPQDTLLASFRTFLGDMQMAFPGSLKLMPGREQVDRNQKVAICCQRCGGQNMARSYDHVRYRGFIYCDNASCDNSFPTQDITDQDETYYIRLLQDAGVASLAQAQSRFPRAMHHLRAASMRKGNESAKYKYQAVCQALAFTSNARPTEHTEVELAAAFEAAISAGAGNIGHIRAALPASINNFITRRMAAGDAVHHRVLERIGFSFKRDHDIQTLDDAITFIRDKGCASWSEFVSRFPGAAESTINAGLKDGVMAEFGWEALINHSRLGDEALLERVATLCQDDAILSLSQLERAHGSLVSNIRLRNLTDKVCAQQGFEQVSNWQGMRFGELLTFLRDRAFTSSSDWHGASSGSYKYAVAQDWLQDLSTQMGWGKYKSLSGSRYDSLPETVVANLLHLFDYRYRAHPAIHQFPGFGGGRSAGDFRLENPLLWVEVWAYGVDETAPGGKFVDYPRRRRYKEAKYHEHNMPLCSIEGGLFYRNGCIPGAPYPRGMSGFVRHVCDCLTRHGYPITYSTELVDTLRKSVSGLSDSLAIEL
ncbi:hypothetical protein [Pseudomonas sp. MWU13-3659]|uniref:hypothetical protein n=1 Tax=Pseudomonas sp. MWU13-3659 TaxID=2986964 RepID=UPI0020752F4B|nr:hypothetical protein [Pseudomonas sp. MWU13-3659]